LSGPLLRIRLRASPALTLLTLAAYVAAAGTLAAVLPISAAVACAILLAALAVLSVREQTLLLAQSAPDVLEFGRDAGLVVRLRGGTELWGQVSPRRYVSRWLVALELVVPGAGRRTILVARDMLPLGEFRHVRLWTLWDAVPAGPAGEGA
jgi:hypothetical protein